MTAGAPIKESRKLTSVHPEIPFFSSPLTGEDEDGGKKYYLIQAIIASPSPVSPPTGGGEIEFPDGNLLIEKY